MCVDVAILLVRAYQRAMSPVFAAAGVGCRFHPTCSAYAIEAIQRHGLRKGFFLGLWRLLRCQPLSKGGVDHP